MNKKKIIGITTIICIAILAGILFVIHANKSDETIALKAIKEVYLEYGEKPDLSIENYVILEGLTTKEKEDVLQHSKVEIVELKIETDKTYPMLGNYQVKVTYKNTTIETNLIVQDTIAPVFNEVEKIEIVQNTEGYDYAGSITAEDLQAVTYEYQTDSVDIHKVGEYQMLVIAKDVSGNKVEKEFLVVVIPFEEMEGNDSVSTSQNATTSNSTKKQTSANDKKNNTNNPTNNSDKSNDKGNSNKIIKEPEQGVNVPTPPKEEPNVEETLETFVPGVGGYFVASNGVKMEQGVNYTFASLVEYDVYIKHPSSTPLSTELRDGTTIYFY